MGGLAGLTETFASLAQAFLRTPDAPQTGAPPAPQEDPEQKLTQLKSMAEKGLITEEEYNKKKAEILSKM